MFKISVFLFLLLGQPSLIPVTPTPVTPSYAMDSTLLEEEGGTIYIVQGKNVITIYFDAVSNASIFLFNDQGQVAYQKQLDGLNGAMSYNLSLVPFPEGEYQLQVTADNLYTEKFDLMKD